jgi:tRNA 2-thiouridine synthesizing protein A
MDPSGVSGSYPPVAQAMIDLTGVVCPINFVKTKLRLEMMNSGDILQVILDKGEPLRNVPRSVRNEGHRILYAEDRGDQAALWIQKA